ncbi:MAG: DeoR/GlpR family DNA-binding transcription regulator [Paracoccus sp. (in: a-proteobacteria)]|uniref:DeoR/GlpR family DNA-binding transcription regulator n=1 Tax=Paracoccus sp. TaxID=267 RepID=UPI0039E6F076
MTGYPSPGPELRQQALMRRLDQGQPLTLAAAARQFGVSSDTIRRDLKALQDRGLARVIRGGALPVARPVRPTLERLGEGAEQIRRLVDAALPLIRDGMAIGLDGGTTVLALAQSLPPLPGSLVVTPAPAVALASLAAGIPTQLVGGRLSASGAISVGHAAVDALSGSALDLAFLGVCGLEAGFGLGADDLDESEVKRAMIAAGHRSVALTLQAKIGRRARHRVASCDRISLLITDASVAQTAALAATGLEVRNV